MLQLLNDNEESDINVTNGQWTNWRPSVLGLVTSRE